MDERQETISLSVVVPLYDEGANVVRFYDRLKPVLDKIGRSHEILMIDDGSKDDTFARLKELCGRDPHLRAIRFRRNFGQTAAMAAGIDHARGDVIVTMDGDLQNDPRDIPTLLEGIDQGYDVVSGWRADRKESFLLRRLPSMVANRLISAVCGCRLHDYGCTLKAYRRELITAIGLYGDSHRFIPALATGMGAAVAEVKVRHYPRTRGQSKYGLNRTFRVILDLLTVKFFLSFATRPMRIFGSLGFLASFVGSVLLLHLSYVKLVLRHGIGGRPLLIVAMLLLLGGLQFITMGLLGEMLTRTHHEVANKTIYKVKETLN
ncbi:MAG TPA: glycosyltransferase family 2 protein [bacterium]|nr:glycosyltransferase family 2 protein [bacterium]HQM51902.1 glycosyltransferase family 2 protein [bacterium]